MSSAAAGAVATHAEAPMRAARRPTAGGLSALAAGRSSSARTPGGRKRLRDEVGEVLVQLEADSVVYDVGRQKGQALWRRLA